MPAATLGGMPWHPLEDLLALVELAAPSVCAGCGRAGTRWCARCQAVLAAPRPRAWRPTPCPPGLPPTWSGHPYEGPVRAAVVSWKEEGRVDLNAVLAGVLREVIETALAGSAPHTRAVRSGAPVVLVPAPSARSGSRARGRRPVLEVTRAACPDGQVVEALDLVRQVRDQAGLTSAERARNLSGAVAVRRSARPRVQGVPCLLVDDVVTSGATLQECSRALLEAGSGPVVAATIAATRRRGRLARPSLETSRPAD